MSDPLAFSVRLQGVHLDHCQQKYNLKQPLPTCSGNLVDDRTCRKYGVIAVVEFWVNYQYECFFVCMSCFVRPWRLLMLNGLQAAPAGNVLKYGNLCGATVESA